MGLLKAAQPKTTKIKVVMEQAKEVRLKVILIVASRKKEPKMLKVAQATGNPTDQWAMARDL
jgi:hypothetical protein